MKKALSTILILTAMVTLLAACGNKTADDKTIVIGASSAPHAEILKVAQAALEEEGYTLDIKVYDDYILPNTATEDGDLDANYFQHQPYLTDFNAENNTHLVSVGSIHYEPYGIYAGTESDLANLPDGAKIAVPNDSTNEARALQLLADNGLIKLTEGIGLEAKKTDIIENPKNFEIVEMEAAVIPTCRDSVAVAVINGNYAIGAGLKVSEALAAEKSDSIAAQTYANVLVVKEGNENLPKIQALLKALQSDTVKTYIESTYDGAVVPSF